MDSTPDETGPRAALAKAFRDRLAAASRLQEATELRRQASDELAQALEHAVDSVFATWQSTWGALPEEIAITMMPIAVYGGVPKSLRTRVQVTLK